MPAAMPAWKWAAIALLTANFCAEAASPLVPFMPRPEDFTLLWWANGPQRYHTMTTAPPEPVLCLQSGTLGLAVDTQNPRLLHAGRLARPLDFETA